MFEVGYVGGVIYYKDADRDILKVVNVNDIVLIRTSPDSNGGYQFQLRNNTTITLNITKSSLDKFVRAIDNVYWLDSDS